jgi:hypothetical protein
MKCSRLSFFFLDKQKTYNPSVPQKGCLTRFNFFKAYKTTVNIYFLSTCHRKLEMDIRFEMNKGENLSVREKGMLRNVSKFETLNLHT